MHLVAGKRAAPRRLPALHPSQQHDPVPGDGDGRRGRVLAHVDEAIAGRSGVDAYFCGPREMVTQLCERLVATGILDERQVYERY